jgi:hypothetical protein
LNEDVIKVLTGRLVDLDIFASGTTEYVLEDIQGERVVVRIPDDVPFPLPLQLAARYDDLVEASAIEERARCEREMGIAWGQLLAVLQRAVGLLAQGETSWDPERFGQGTILGFVNALNVKWQFHAVSGSSMEDFVEQLLRPKLEAEGDPKAGASTSAAPSEV